MKMPLLLETSSTAICAWLLRWSESVLRVEPGGYVARTSLVGDGDKGQAQVTDLGEQPVQRGLIGHVTAKGSGPVCGVAQREPVGPGAPSLVEGALDADPVPDVLSAGTWTRAACAHAPDARCRCDELSSPQVVIAVVTLG